LIFSPCRVYDGQAYNGSGGVTYSSQPNTTNLFGSVIYNSGINAGNSPIALSGLYSNQQGYIIAYVNGTLTIGKADLTVTVNSAMGIYGSTIPTLSGTVTGFVNGQTLTSDGGTAVFTTTATSSSNLGNYGVTGDVTLGSPYSGDYTVLQARGNGAALTITFIPPPLYTLFDLAIRLPFTSAGSNMELSPTTPVYLSVPGTVAGIPSNPSPDLDGNLLEEKNTTK
jgi:hypothetical protein